jgi:hypothetical protein
LPRDVARHLGRTDHLAGVVLDRAKSSTTPGCAGRPRQALGLEVVDALARRRRWRRCGLPPRAVRAG